MKAIFRKQIKGTFYFSLIFLFPSLLFAQDNSELLTPFTLPTYEQIQIIDGKNFCHIGYGSQSIYFQLGTTQEKHTSNFKIESSPYFGMGCYASNFSLSFSRSELIVRKLDSSFTVDSTSYNGFNLTTNSVEIGYMVPLVSHYLYTSVGVGWQKADFEYKSSSHTTTANQIEENAFYSVGVQLFISNSTFISWKLESVSDSEKVIQQKQVISFHFYKRFN
ncbi:MAG: hypothetical protein ACI86H_002640 [bacterium]|jgi:hypothetical protein